MTPVLERSRLRGRLALRMLAVGVLMAAGLVSRNPYQFRAMAYEMLREAALMSVGMGLASWPHVEGEHFMVYYRPEDKDIAPLVLKAAERDVSRVNQILDFEQKDTSPVIIYPDRASLGRNFGWAADESAMGVYWGGVIRVLSPRVWIEPEDQENLVEVFTEAGPMVHEYAHLVIDYLTRGNYPRWLTEGLAQYVEREVTGFQFPMSPAEGRGEWYPLSQMDQGFDALPDQKLAYRQSLLLVDYVAGRWGFGAWLEILHNLGEARRLPEVLDDAISLDLAGLEEQFKDENNWSRGRAQAKVGGDKRWLVDKQNGKSF